MIEMSDAQRKDREKAIEYFINEDKLTGVELENAIQTYDENNGYTETMSDELVIALALAM